MSARSSDCPAGPGRASGRRRWPRTSRAPGVGPAEPARPPSRRRPGRRGGPRRHRDRPHQLSVGDHRRGARVGQDVGHLGRGQAGVHGHGHATGPVGGRVGDEPAQGQLGAQVDADPAAGLETGLEETAGHGVGGTVPLGEGQGPDVDHGERGSVGELLGHAAQMLVHQHWLGSPLGRCRFEKLTPVSGSLQHGRCAREGQSRRR